MKIAQILPALSNKGPVSVAYDLTGELVKMGHIVEVFYFDDKVELKYPCRTTRIGFFEKKDFSTFDIIHSHCLRPNLYVALHLARNKRIKAKLISTLHQPLTLDAIKLNYDTYTSNVIHILDKYSHYFFDVNVVLSPEQKRLSLSNLKVATIRIIGNGRNVFFSEVNDKCDKQLLLDAKRKYKIIGSVSAINQGKGLEQIIEVLPLLPDWCFLCVGDGPTLESLKAKAKANKVLDRCIFLGYRANGNAYYKYFDVFVMTTRSEGFPLAYIEAAANSIPTVLSDIPILRSVTNEEYVSFYELDNIPDLYSKIKMCYENREKYSLSIHSHYLNELTAKKMAENYLSVYNEFIK